MKLAACLFLVAVTAGCSSSGTPISTPEGMDSVVSNLVLRGVTVHRLVSGDAGCPGSTLHDNAVQLEISTQSQSDRYTIYLLRWRRAADFEASGPEFAV